MPGAAPGRSAPVASRRARRAERARAGGPAALRSVSACSTGNSSSSTPASASAAMPGGTVPAAVPVDQPFGAACDPVPRDGAGAFSGMAQDPVATAASNNPLLSTLVAAVRQAGPVETLNSAQDITVFAPASDAFAKVPKADLDALLTDKAALTRILTYHVTPERLAPNSPAGTHRTPESGDLTGTGSEADFTVTQVLCGDVQTANATACIVDTLLIPTS
ncbi:fasciclin domain-containing protein [Kitasatospora griseola]|uniref:fasciclin domain-containing protein n=1 Tax=Kitasatospora griseola TaxID=2064 RepID=UPI00364F3286